MSLPSLPCWEGAHIYHACDNLHCISVCQMIDLSLTNQLGWRRGCCPVIPRQIEGVAGLFANHCREMASGERWEGPLCTKLGSVEKTPGTAVARFSQRGGSIFICPGTGPRRICAFPAASFVSWNSQRSEASTAQGSGSQGFLGSQLGLFVTNYNHKRIAKGSSNIW